MATRDNLSNTQSVLAGTLALSGTTPASTDWVDVRDFDAALLQVTTDTVTDAGTVDGFSFVMEENDDTTDAGATTVATAEILGSLSDLTVTADGDDNKLIGAVGYVGNARYIRLTGTGTTLTDAGVKVHAILTNAHRAATTYVGTGVAAT